MAKPRRKRRNAQPRTHTITLPLFYREVGEILLKAHPEYSASTREKLLQQFAHEAFVFSMMPSEAIGGANLKGARLAKRGNPGTPMLPEKVYQVFDWAFGDQGFFAQLPIEERVTSLKRFRSAVSALVTLYAETALGLEKSAFALSTDADEKEQGQVLVNQYLRYFVVALIMSALGSVFRVNGSRLRTELARLGVDPSKTSLSQLRSQKSRVAFAKAVERDMSKLFENVDVISALQTASKENSQA